jgi:hypothetical protein
VLVPAFVALCDAAAVLRFEVDLEQAQRTRIRMNGKQARRDIGFSDLRNVSTEPLAFMMFPFR